MEEAVAREKELLQSREGRSKHVIAYELRTRRLLKDFGIQQALEMYSVPRSKTREYERLITAYALFELGYSKHCPRFLCSGCHVHGSTTRMALGNLSLSVYRPLLGMIRDHIPPLPPRFIA